MFGIFHEKSMLLLRRVSGVHGDRVRVDCVLLDLGPTGGKGGSKQSMQSHFPETVAECRERLQTKIHNCKFGKGLEKLSGTYVSSPNQGGHD
jgi:hypothetical protein